ncbi:MAG: hypothetical protein QNJ65_05875 [Xenococcaceae cyanobacterium MO_234.B1]|nr:hypothetical protein [Xenococcaceae cyanobacterium MO_234.B1]
MQRLRDLENKVVIENCIPDISVSQSIPFSQNNGAYPTVKEVNLNLHSSQNASPLDVTQLPILEEYC